MKTSLEAWLEWWPGTPHASKAESTQHGSLSTTSCLKKLESHQSILSQNVISKRLLMFFFLQYHMFQPVVRYNYYYVNNNFIHRISIISHLFSFPDDRDCPFHYHPLCRIAITNCHEISRRYFSMLLFVFEHHVFHGVHTLVVCNRAVSCLQYNPIYSIYNTMCMSKVLGTADS